MKGFSLLAVIALLGAVSLHGETTFSDLDLSGDDRLLFRGSVASSGLVPQGALFQVHLSEPRLQQLTVFPEALDYLEQANAIQVRGAFGTTRIPLAGGLPESAGLFPAFSDGAPPLGGRTESMAASSDGKWILYVEPHSAGYGDLVLINAEDGGRALITEGIERPGRVFPASWSPDSRVFLYSREGKLYYQTVDALANNAPVDERLRLVGEGGIRSAVWRRGGEFFYLRGSAVFQVRASELFARTVYESFLESGRPIGQLPFAFDSEFDTFWVAPDGRSILVARDSRSIFYIALQMEDSLASLSSGPLPQDFRQSYADSGRAGVFTLPYLALPWSAAGIGALWSPEGILTVFAQIPGAINSSVPSSGGRTIAYRLDPRELFFKPLSAPPGERLILSPDGKRALSFGAQGAFIFDYGAWRTLEQVGSLRTYSAVWLSPREFILGDSSHLERITLGIEGRVESRRLLCLAEPREAAFEENTGRILASDGSAWYVTDGRAPWALIENPVVRPASLVSDNYRAYLEPQREGSPYRNMPMLRNTSSVGTFPLLSSGTAYRRTRGDLALSFDLYGDAAGLVNVLEALDRFGVRATFFLNGEFIRRHPDAARALAESGHELGSLFYAPLDFSDPQYNLQGDFVARGLARNEDEFYRATGAELSLLWHPPYYTVSGEIAAAAAEAGYVTLSPALDPLDWVTREDANALGIPQRSAAEMIDRIMENLQGRPIIPIRLGLLPGGRRDYLFNSLEVLLDALGREGLSTVPVSEILNGPVF